MSEKEKYFSYLLRIWQETSSGVPDWRASLVDAETNERRSFPQMKDLMDFLEEKVNPDPEHETRR